MQKSYSKHVADKIIYLFQKHGEELYFGESVTQTQHAFQCLHLACMQSEDVEMQLAAFLHDIGHLCEEENLNNGMVGYGIVNHELEGARHLLELGFSHRLCKLVENHVLAKRYLVTVDKNYEMGLSEASRKTLAFQGGRLNEMEVVDFEKSPDLLNYILLRRWDDLGKSLMEKEENWKLVRELIEKHLKTQMYLKAMNKI